MSDYYIEKTSDGGKCVEFQPITLEEILKQEGIGWRSVEDELPPKGRQQ